MGPCWYFYSLMVMRMVMQLLPERRWVYVLLFAVLSAGAIGLHHIGFEASNANVNVLLCMPFFLIGVLLKPLRGFFTALHHYVAECVTLVVAATGVVLCGNYNGYVWMYLNGYGDSYALYILGGMAGAAGLYVVSLWLSRLPYRQMVTTISGGSLLIIGLHIVIVRRLTELPDRLWVEDLVWSVLIVFCFVPLIRLAGLFFPVLLGRYRRESLSSRSSNDEYDGK